MPKDQLGFRSYSSRYVLFLDRMGRADDGLQGSEAPVKKHEIIKAVGTLHGFRQKLNLEDENLLDEPEFLWEDEALHGALSLPPPLVLFLIPPPS